MADHDRRRFLTEAVQSTALVVGASLPLVSVGVAAFIGSHPKRIDPAPSALAVRAALIAVAEWRAWGGQYVDGEDTSGPIMQSAGAATDPAVETDPAYKEKVRAYFRQGVYPDSDDWRRYEDEAWSAAFISYCMRKAGVGAAFPYAIGHHRYVGVAVRNALTGARQNTLVAFDSAEAPPRLGDLLWRGRRNAAGLDTSWWGKDRILKHLRDGWDGFPSHCDLVTSVDPEAGRLHAIGGNLADRVLRLQSRIDQSGRLQDSGYRMVIRNNIGKFAIR